MPAIRHRFRVPAVLLVLLLSSCGDRGPTEKFSARPVAAGPVGFVIAPGTGADLHATFVAPDGSELGEVNYRSSSGRLEYELRLIGSDTPSGDRAPSVFRGDEPLQAPLDESTFASVLRVLWMERGGSSLVRLRRVGRFDAAQLDDGVNPPSCDSCPPPTSCVYCYHGYCINGCH